MILPLLSCHSSILTSPKTTKLFINDTIACAKFHRFPLVQFLLSCIVFCELACSNNFYPQSTNNKKGKILKKQNNNLKNEKGVFFSCFELIISLLPKRIKCLLLLLFLLLQTRIFFFLLILLLQTRKRKKEKKQEEEKSLQFFSSNLNLSSSSHKH